MAHSVKSYQPSAPDSLLPAAICFLTCSPVVSSPYSCCQLPAAFCLLSSYALRFAALENGMANPSLSQDKEDDRRRHQDRRKGSDGRLGGIQ